MAGWTVWSVDTAKGYRGLDVAEGARWSKAEAEANAKQRNESAVAHHMRAVVFVAVPAGSDPTREQIDEVLAARAAELDPQEGDPAEPARNRARTAQETFPGAPEGERVAPGAEVDWVALLTDLLELDQHDALGGIAAVVQARLALVRAGREDSRIMHGIGVLYGDWDNDLAQAAALIAFEIDQQQG